MTKNGLKLKCVFSKCFHGPKRERKKPLNKGLQGDFVLFELRPPSIIENIFVNVFSELFSIFNSIFHYLLDIPCGGSKMVAFIPVVDNVVIRYNLIFLFKAMG